MTVDLIPAPTDEQAMVRDATARFLRQEFPLSRVRERIDGRGVVDAGYRKAAAALGWFGLLADEEHGGGSASGNGLLDAALIAAERGAVLQPGPFAGHSVVVDALSAAGGPAPLADLISGMSWATWIAGPGVHLLADGLSGQAGAVAEAGDCDWFLVSAATPDGPAHALVAAGAPGVTVRLRDGLDLTRRWFSVTFDAVEPALVLDASARRQHVAAVLTAAEAVGAMHAHFALALDYAKTRIAFGRPIGSFQAVKHLLADTSLWLETSKAIVVAAAESVGRGDPDGGALAHAATSFVGERAGELAQNCFQVFGGIGYTWEHDQHLFLRRLAADTVVFGSPARHRAHLLELGGLSR